MTESVSILPLDVHSENETGNFFYQTSDINFLPRFVGEMVYFFLSHAGEVEPDISMDDLEPEESSRYFTFLKTQTLTKQW